MTTPSPPPLTQAVMNFGIEGLAARDEVLLKSLVRLLDHRTLHRWQYEAQPDRVQLLVVGEEAKPTCDALVLRMGRTPIEDEHFLRLPLQADALERMLNQLGKLVIQNQLSDRLTNTHNRNNTSLSTAGAPFTDLSFRIAQWPPAHLLHTPERLKLATLLVRQSISVDTLQERSGFTRKTCESFIQEMQHAGLLTVHTAKTQATDSNGTRTANNVTGFRPSPPPKIAQGLLARIRTRLGLFR